MASYEDVVDSIVGKYTDALFSNTLCNNIKKDIDNLTKCISDKYPPQVICDSSNNTSGGNTITVDILPNNIYSSDIIVEIDIIYGFDFLNSNLIETYV